MPLFMINAEAENTESGAGDITEVHAVESNLPADVLDITGELKTDGSFSGTEALRRLWNRIISYTADSLRNEMSFALKILSITVFCALASALCTRKNIPDYINTAGCCTAAYMISGCADGIIRQAADAIFRLSDYSRAALPAIFTAAAACGAVTSASVKYASACLAVELFMSAAKDLIIPLIYSYTAVSLSSAVFDNSVLNAAAGFCRSTAVMLMSGICLAFSAYIGLSGLIAGSTDALAVKTARTVISNSLPVVGSIISDSASVVLASAALIKNSAGIFSLIAVCALCAGPFALLSVKMLLYKAVSAAADMLPGGRMSALLDSMGKAMAMLMGLIGSCGIMLFISIMSGIRVVTV